MKHLLSIAARVLALALLASVLVVAPRAEEVSAQTNPQWECDGTPILMRGGQFHFIVPDPAVPGNLTIDTIAGTSGIWNSTAYDPTTNWVYGVGNIGGEKTIRAYDANGDVVFQTQIQDPYPDAANAYAGTVLGDGRYIIHSVGNGAGNGWYNGARFNLWSIDPASGAATYIGSTPVNFADFSYNPLDGFLYQVVNRLLYKVDPNTGATTTTAMPAEYPNGSFGASWFDAAGFLYLFRNTPGDIFKVDPNDTSTWVEVGEPGSNGGTDAGSCVSQIDIKKDVVDAAGDPVLPADRVYSVGDTVTYQVTLINNGLPTQNRTVDLCDILPGDGRTFTGTWSSSDPTASITSGGAAGDTSVCFEADMPSSLWTDPANPGATPTTVTFDVVLGDDIIPGDYENQATLDFDQDGTVDVLSDDPGDGSDPRDPTTIEVLGAFTVSKAVEGHPVSNDTDEFTMTLACTTAAGTAFDVAPGSIVDAATGAAWPGAATNSFTITNADEVQIENLPAGATCTVTEADDTAYTATVAVAAGSATGSATGATSTGTLTTDLVNDNCQDGDASGFNPFNLQLRNASPNTTAWEMIWRNRPYDTIPNLNSGAWTHTVIPAPGGLFDHVFTGTTPLGAWGSMPAITGNPPTPPGTDSGCGDVEIYGGVTGPATGGGDTGGGTVSTTADITIDSAIADEAVAYTNQTSTIELIKNTAAGGALSLDEDGTFTFAITCDNGLSETVTVTTVGGTATLGYPDTPLVGAGATCTVTETVPTGWQLTSPNDVELVTDPTATQTAEFDNERILADLTISKTILGLPDGEDPTTYTFDLEVTCSGGFDPDPFATTGTFAVGSPLVIEDLPAGATCLVTEAPAPGFNTRYSPGQKVEIGPKGTAVDITNSTGSLIIDKTTIAPTTHPIDPLIDVEFLLECRDLDGVITTDTYTVAVDSLNATGANGGLAHTDIGVIAPGTTCRVTETAVPGWTATSPTTVVLDVTEDNPEPTAFFENTRDTGSLTITKTIDGVPAGIDLTNELFTVDVSCSGGFTVDPYLMSGLTVSASTPLVIDDLPAGADCTVTETPDPRFEATVGSGTTTIDTDGETIGLVNTTSTFTLEKTTVATPAVGSSDGTFTFAVVCVNGGTEVANTTVDVTTSANTGTAAVGDLPLVPPGSTCTVTEAVPGGWTLTDRTGGTPSGTDAIEVDTAVAAPSLSFENTLHTADLTISKDVTGAAATPALEAETFTVNVSCTGNVPGGTFTSGALALVEGTDIVIPGLPVGSQCTIVETADPRFATTYAPGDVVLVAFEGTTVDITNETSSFSISKNTSVPAGVNPDQTFTFDISCVNGGTVVFTDTVVITTSGGTGTWGAPDAPLVPPGTDCNIAETVPAAWAAIGSADITITTTGTAIVDAAFTNERAVADLTITKTLLGPGSEAFATEPFTVDVTCVGDFATSPLVIDDIVVTSVAPATIPNLPTGAVCTVSEDFDSRFQALYAPDIGDETAAQVTIDADGAEAGITNVTGSIAVRKDTIGPNEHGENLLVDIDYIFDCDTLGAPFTRTLSVADLTGGQGIGVITFTDLPVMAAGTICEVTEVVPAGWTVTSVNPQTVVAQPDPPFATFSNERDTGALTVTKVLDGVPAGVDLGDEPFTVDITCTGGDLLVDPYQILGETITATTPLAISNLPTGTECSVVETPDPRFSSAISAPVTIDQDGEEIIVTNTTSTLTITKTTTGATTHPIDLDGMFSFGVDCGAAFDEVVLIATSGQTGSWDTTTTPLLPPGTSCTVTEQGIPPGWALTTAADVTVTTESGTIVDAPFTNERLVAPLTITKTVQGEPTDLSNEPFIVNVSCIGGLTTEPYLLGPFTITENAPAQIDDLPVGAACEVTEVPDARFLPSYDPDDQVGVIVEGGTEVGIVNRTAELEITKQVTAANDQPINVSGSFDVAVDCTDGTALTVTLDVVGGVAETLGYPDLPLVPDGTACIFTEVGPPTGWTLTTANDVERIASSENPAAVTFINERDTADLTVTKTVLGAPAGLDLATTIFTVDVSCVGDFDTSPLVFADQPILHGETITFPNLPTGSVCTVVEDPDPRFAATTTPATATTTGVTIDADGEDVAIVNATGEVMIVKTTEVTTTHPVDVTGSFTFAVDCGAAYSGTHVVDASTITSPTTATGFLRYSDIPALPDGALCSVTEQGPPTGWTLVDTDPVAVTVDDEVVALAEFTNTRDTGPLTITKELDGVPAGTDLDAELFNVAITCTGDFTGGTHTINGQISVDAPLTITELPTGATCSVTETPDPRFTTTVTAPVTIDTDGEALTVTNTTSTLSITKTTTGAATNPLDLDATFTFAVDCGADFTGTIDITTTGQTGTWATPDTPLLPPGTSCTITETPVPTGWTVGTAVSTVTTDSATIVDAAFNNTRDTGPLTITKELDGVPAGTDLDAELFNVAVTCSGDFTGGTHTINGQISVDAPLTIDELPTGAICSATETADPRFSTEITAPATIDTDGEAITVTNTTSTLSITKTTTGAATNPLELDGLFSFAVDCGADFTGTIDITTTGQTGTWATPDTPLLPPGTSCTITETAVPAGWTITGLDEQVVVTDSATIVDAPFVNTRDSAPLTITKVVEGTPPGLDFDDVLFDVTITCTGDFAGGTHTINGQVSANTPLVIGDLPTGATCDIVEADDARFLTSYSPANVDGSAATATITDGGVSAEITNTTGGIIISKETVVPATHPIDPVDTFSFTVDCGASYSEVHEITTDLITTTGALGVLTAAELPALAEGTSCEITELDETPDWVLTSDRTVPLTISSAAPQTAEFVNEHVTGSLVIDKLVEGPDNVDLSGEIFDITVTCVGGFTEDPYVMQATVSAASPHQIDDLPYGADCSVVETPDPRFATSYPDVDAMIAVDDPAGPSTLSILNQTGSFVIDKSTFINSDRPLDPDDEFTFIISCTHDNGETYEETITITTEDGEGIWTSPLLPTGHECTIELVAPDGWSVLSNEIVDFTVGTGVLVFEFESERSLVDLTINKTLASIPSGVDYSDHDFTITVECDTGFETTDYTIPGDQVVSQDAALVIEDLPATATCTVTEAADELFTPTYSPAQEIELAADGDNAITITNTATQALIDSTIETPLAFTGTEASRLVLLGLLMMGSGVILLGGRRFTRTEEV